MSPEPVGPLVPEAFASLLTGRAVDRALGRTPAPGIDGDAWLASLPRLVSQGVQRWELTVAGRSRFGHNALVVPVRRRDGSDAALKVSWPHPEAEHEHLALRTWGGRGAVHLLAADPASWTLLLERLDPDRDLARVELTEACLVLGDLLATMRGPASPRMPRLSAVLAGLAARLDAAGRAALPRRFLHQARGLSRDLAGEPGVDAELLHTDLHFGNVLAGGADRGWVAIDPKPIAGDPAYGVWPALHNRWTEVLDGDVRWNVHCRLGWVCEPAGLEEDRARAYALVRTVQFALDRLERDPRADVTAPVTLMKALQPGP